MIFLELAKRNLRLHYIRTILAMLGIAIGVIAIATLGILGNMMYLSISSQFSDIGSVMNINPGRDAPMDADNRGYLTERHLQTIQQITIPDPAIGVYSGSDIMQFRNSRSWTNIYGLSMQDMPTVAEIEEGIFPRTSGTAAIGKTLAEDNNFKLGDKVELLKLGNVEIVGILKNSETRMSGLSADRAFVITKEWYTSVFDSLGYDSVLVKLSDTSKYAQLMSTVETALNKRDKTIINIWDTSSFSEMLSDSVGQISMFLTAIGGVSLLVAGVSIFNIMIMSVNERITEIGIMRSIGVLRREIMVMFVYEGVLLGTIGSIAGGVLSLLAGYAIGNLMDMNEHFFNISNALPVLQAISMGILLCLLCTLYPAYMASKQNPIDAIR
ncbi:MAG: ABC transporter permease, partial [Methanomicrobiales archaeon]|nr:ABC transporter permease [Methanomicrobiales archaeon]